MRFPKNLAEDPDEKAHSIIVHDLLNPNGYLVILLSVKVVKSYFQSRNPSEYEDETIHHINITR